MKQLETLQKEMAAMREIQQKSIAAIASADSPNSSQVDSETKERVNTGAGYAFGG